MSWGTPLYTGKKKFYSATETNSKVLKKQMHRGKRGVYLRTLMILTKRENLK